MIPERLQTSRLLLRPFQDGDGAAVHAYWKSDPGWERFNVSVPEGFSEGDAEGFVADMCGRDRLEKPAWALVHDGSVVGVVSLVFQEEHRVALLGYGIHGRLRGLGLCGEAARHVLSCAFACHPELHRVLAHTDATHGASIRVLEKLGFSREQADEPTGGATFCVTRTQWETQALEQRRSEEDR